METLCELCGGSGEIDVEYPDDDDEIIIFKECCPLCEGVGYIDIEPVYEVPDNDGTH